MPYRVVLFLALHKNHRLMDMGLDVNLICQGTVVDLVQVISVVFGIDQFLKIKTNH